MSYRIQCIFFGVAQWLRKVACRPPTIGGVSSTLGTVDNQSECGQLQPYREVADSGRSMALSTQAV